MIEHRNRAPRQKITVPPARRPNECPYCTEPGYISPGPCRKCGTSGYVGQEPPAHRRYGKRWKKPQPDPTYRPKLDGLQGSTQEPVSELSDYEQELARLEVPVEGEEIDAGVIEVDQAEELGVPWD